MPHDRNGDLLEKGDKVLLHAEVQEVHTGETACNCDVVVSAPEGEYTPHLTLNSRSLTIVGKAGLVLLMVGLFAGQAMACDRGALCDSRAALSSYQRFERVQQRVQYVERVREVPVERVRVVERVKEVPIRVERVRVKEVPVRQVERVRIRQVPVRQVQRVRVRRGIFGLRQVERISSY